jgi:hypothetical protein
MKTADPFLRCFNLYFTRKVKCLYLQNIKVLFLDSYAMVTSVVDMSDVSVICNNGLY